MIEFRSNGCMNSIPPATKNLILINFFVFIFTQLRPEFMHEYFSLFYPSSQYFHWWQPVTHMFM
ncbi:MAG: rhomboid family intramembrane serine protease, partial [Bacteroidales bacterium]|nr:rhomboid family intramembrane serine protease [Bacteroidales bacterium]